LATPVVKAASVTGFAAPSLVWASAGVHSSSGAMAADM